MSFPAVGITEARPAATLATLAARCAHCDLPVSGALRTPGASLQFCCAGCRSVHALLQEHGLTRFYELHASTATATAASSAKPPKAAPVPDPSEFQEFDDPAFQHLYCRALPDGTRRVELSLEGIHCAACVWLLEKLPRLVPGLVDLRVHVGRATALATWDPRRTSLAEVGGWLARFGYRPRPRLEGGAADAERRHEERALLIRLALTGAVAGNVMMIAFALYGGAFHGMAEEFTRLFRWASLIITVPAVLVGGGVFFRGAWLGLRARVLHMDLPISIGILAGFAGGVYGTVRGLGEVYFDSVTALIFLLLVGRFLQRRQQQRAAEASRLLFGLAPRRARRLGPEGARDVPAEALAVGDRIEVRAGEVVPADGQVEEGCSDLDLSVLTGESRPVAVGVGGQVHAGTLNITGRLRVRVERAGAATRVGQLLALVEEYGLRRARIVQTADRLAGWFVAAVLALAGLTLGVWLEIQPERALDHTLALLVVTCPCALGLATPLALAAALGRASRAGLLIKGGDALELLAARRGVLWLDKTGTLTEGRLELVAWDGDEAGQRLAAALEAHSSHPVAAAVQRAFGAPGEEATGVMQVPGGGMEGRVGAHEVCFGAPRFVAGRGALGAATEARIQEFTARGLTPVVLAVDGAVRAVAGFGDPVRRGMPGVLARLAAAGWELGVLSGDHPEVVRALGVELGLPAHRCRGGMSPEDKLAAVQASQRAQRPVVMVGDGVNDAVALAAADVGIGVHGGAEATLTAADVYLTRPDPELLEELFAGARRTLRVIRRNLVLSLGYNLLGAVLAMAGYIHPLAAAVLMPISSLTVVASSYQARTFRARSTPRRGEPAAVAPLAPACASRVAIAGGTP